MAEGNIKNRSKVEKYIIDLMNITDKSGFNTRYYKNLFSELDDKMFHEWYLRLKRGDTKLYFFAPNMEVSTTAHAMLEGADFVGLTVFEKISLYDESTKRRYMTPHEHLVLKLPVRRLKQYLQGKTSIPDNDRTVNGLTGQVSNPDKGSSISTTEAQTLDSKGLHKCLTELTNYRGGNVEAYDSLRSSLIETGSASFNDLSVGEIGSVRSANILLKAAHIDNNL